MIIFPGCDQQSRDTAIVEFSWRNETMFGLDIPYGAITMPSRCDTEGVKDEAVHKPCAARITGHATLSQPEERKHCQNDDNQSDQINDVIHSVLLMTFSDQRRSKLCAPFLPEFDHVATILSGPLTAPLICIHALPGLRRRSFGALTEATIQSAWR